MQDNSFPKLSKQIKDSSKQAKSLNKEAKKATSTLDKAINFGAIYIGLRQTFDIFKQFTDESINYTETVNLFNVSLGKGLEGLNQYYEKAIDFQERLEEKLSVNIEESMRFQALFNSMSKSMGLSANYAYILSENMTKLGYDLSSLYNIDPESAMTKLRAGLAGQTEPLRDLGIDITEQSLKPIAQSLGVTESIRNMSQAEKTVLRYIAVLKQAQIAQGDFANTMESPANQLRIFNAQVTAFKRNMGNLWQGILGGILPYVNAVMMVINELLKMVAKLFGFEVSSQPVNVSAGIGADDLADDLGDASDNAKKLKNQLMGFDEINNITLNENSSDDDSSSIGGIDKRLLDAMTEYDNLMDKVSNKATEIRDKILDWLGFTKDVNGNLKWSWNDMNNIAKILTTIAGIIAGIYVVGKIVKTISALKNLVSVLKTGQGATTTFGLGIQAIGKFINSTKTGFLNMKSWVSMVVEQYKKFREQGNGVISSLKQTHSELKNTNQGFLDMIPTTVKVVGGIAGLISTSVLAYKSMEDLSNGTIESGEAFTKLTVSIGGATASGALLGSTFGPVGTAIGAVTGLLISSVSAFMGYNTRLQEISENNKKVKETLESTIATHEANIKAIEENRDAQLVNIEVAKKESEQLEHMIDANGRVKDSYKQRAEYILNDLNEALGTDYTLTGNQIAINGELIDSYEELQGTIDDYIKKKEEEIYLESYLDVYKDEIKESIELQKQQKEAQQRTNEAMKEYNKCLEEGRNQVGTLGMAVSGFQTTWAKNEYDKAIENEKAIGEQIANNALDVVNAEESWKNYYTEITNDSTEAMNTIAETTEQTLISQTQTVQDLTPDTIEAWRNMASQSASEYETNLLKTSTATQLVLDALVGNVDVTTPTYIEKWRKLANDSEAEYYEALSKLPEDTQGQILASIAIVDGMNETNINAYENLSEKGRQAFNNALSDIDVDTRNKIQSSINEVYGQQGNMSSATSSLGASATNSFNNSLGSTTGSANNWLQGFVNVLSKWDPLGILSKAQNLAEKVCERFNIGLGNHSPSKKTRKSADFFVEGFRKQIDRLMPSSVAQISSFAQQITNGFNDNLQISSLTDGFNVDTNAISVDTNQFLDYGEISGSIATQSNVSINDSISGQIRNAVIEGMRNSSILVNIEAKTEKGITLKTVQSEVEEYMMQTGESPFPTLA